MNLILRKSYQFSISKFNSAKDYYKILGVSQSSGQKDVKKAFRELAKKYHPDAASGNEEKFKQVNQAYQVLSQPSVKRQYDEARSYTTQQQRPQSGQSSYNYPYGNQSYQQQSGNYANGQYYYNQTFHQSYQHPSQQYRGYSKPDGWQNQRYREDIMNQIFKQYQRNRSQYGTFENMYQNHQQNIRQYTQELKRRQQNIRKAYQAQQMRKQQEWRNYQDQQLKDLEQKIRQKVTGLKEGFVKNVQGFIKVGDFLKDTLKDTFKSVKDSLKDKDNKKK